MKISFDLDDTLIPARKTDFPTIKRNVFQKLLNIEFLRHGTVELFRKLQSEGHNVGIYTTSYRSNLKIRFQFMTYGLKLAFVVNEKANRKKMKEISVSASKYPPAFGIDLHIDDSEGVAIEGDRLNFRTIIIRKDQMNWVSEIAKHMN